MKTSRQAASTALLAVLLLAGCGAAPRALQAGTSSQNTPMSAAEAPAPGLDADDAKTFLRGTAQPVPAGHTGRWLAVTNHNHSAYWDGDKPLTLMQSEAVLSNFDAMVLTDHNTMRGCDSPEFKNPPHGLIMVRGMEWGAFREKGETVVGHAGLLGLKGDPPPTNLGLDAMLSQATSEQATIIINHPFCLHNTWAQPAPDPRAHAVEVWNGWWSRVEPIMHNDKALAWWEDSLRKGRHLTAVSGTDNHGDWPIGNIARNVDMVFAETPDQDGILAAIRAGRVSITASPTSARLYLEADADGDGTFESMMGDSLPHPVAGKLSVRARVLGGKGKKVVFYTAAGRQAIADIKSDDATIPFQVSLRSGADYVRAEVRSHPHLFFSMTAISNPIYVNP